MKNNIIRVKDGDDIFVIVELDPSLNDPAGIYPGIAQGFRVIANSSGPTLKLVSLKDEPTLLTDLRNNA